MLACCIAPTWFSKINTYHVVRWGIDSNIMWGIEFEQWKLQNNSTKKKEKTRLCESEYTVRITYIHGGRP